MKQKLYEEYLPYLAKKTGILFLSNNHLDGYDGVKELFHSAIQRNITPSALEHLSNTLIHSKIDIVIIDSDMDNKMLVSFIEKIKSFNSSIQMILVYDEKDIDKLLSIISSFNLIIERKLCDNQLMEKLFMLSSIPYILEKLSNETKYVNKHKDTTSIKKVNNMDEYLDTYEGVSLFAIEDLSSICSSLRSGELSNELIKNSSVKLQEISDIFSHYDKMNSIVLVLQNLSLFLKNLNLSKLNPESLKGFDYLAAILDDVSGALLNMFVDRIFTDVRIIEHSLENNINFMKNALLGTNNNGSRLDFF